MKCSMALYNRMEHWPSAKPHEIQNQQNNDHLKFIENWKNEVTKVTTSCDEQ